MNALSLASLAKSILNPSVRRRMEHGLVTLALVMFCIHLGLYGLGQLGALILPASLFSHPLQSLYTPFSIILIAEVYLLVYYCPPRLRGPWENRLKLSP